MPTVSRFLSAMIFVSVCGLLAQAARAQFDTPAAPAPVTQTVKIQFQAVSVAPDELSKAEKRAAAAPITASSIAAQLPKGLVGAAAEKLRGQLNSNGQSLQHQKPMSLTTEDGVAKAFSTSMPVTTAQGKSTTQITTLAIEPHVQQDGTVTIKIDCTVEEQATAGQPTPKPQDVSASLTIPQGQMAAVTLPGETNKPQRLIFLEAGVTAYTGPAIPPQTN